MALMEIHVPDIGDFDEVTVIELMVKAGDTVAVDQSLITVESDKASMEIPSSHGGVVQQVAVKLGDKVKQGSVVLVMEVAGIAAATPPPGADAPAPVATDIAAVSATPASPAPPAPMPATAPVPVMVPDIGDFKDVTVIEVMVKVGDTVNLSSH